MTYTAQGAPITHPEEMRTDFDLRIGAKTTLRGSVRLTPAGIVTAGLMTVAVLVADTALGSSGKAVTSSHPLGCDDRRGTLEEPPRSDRVRRDIFALQIPALEGSRMRTSGNYANYLQAWSKDDQAKLIEMRQAGVPFLVIAKELGRTQASCEGRWYQLKKTRVANDPSNNP